jgi:predicted Zn-dependent protease
MPDAQWEFVVFESREVNAFCLPGGKVGIYTGILPITKDEAGLATVIGHEVAHAARRHGAERLTLGLPVQVGGEVVNAYMNANDPKHQQAAATVYGVATKLLLELPHSRTQESEADKVGLFFMARAGYPPAAAVSFWERFAAHNRQAGGGGPGFLRTHPLDERRIQDLKTWLPEAQPLYRGP